MKIKNSFFKKNTNVYLNDIFKVLKIKKYKEKKINDIKDLLNSKKNDLSFFNSLKYLDQLKKTKSEYILTELKYKNIVETYCKPIVVDNIFKSVSLVTLLFYPDSLDDTVDFNLFSPKKKNYSKVTFGKNVLIGKKVQIGINTIVGHNTIIESNVRIGKNCSIGNNILIKNSIIGNNVRILDGAVIGKKGFGFFPIAGNNKRYPHIGMVIVEDNVEIGCNNTIDRGSISDTCIGKNTFIDNQVHIAHNVKIGDNCIITGQVGFAGSSTIGNNVQIGGQAGISGHLKIGSNVQIAGEVEL